MSDLEKSKKRGKVVILSGPSGSGKSTICNALVQNNMVCLSVSVTTRAKRPYEKEGIHYFFVSPTNFQEQIQQGKFLEYAQFLDAHYGTPLKPVEENVKQGKIVLLDIDIQGQEIIKRKKIACLSIFISPPSLEILEERLRARKTESEKEIKKRLGQVQKEIKKAPLYDYQIVNDDLEKTIQKVCELISLPVGKWLKIEEIWEK